MSTTYRRHNCNSHHRSASTFLRCAIRNLAWCSGSGVFGVIAWCRIPTATLWGTAEEAHSALDQVSATGCGGRCVGRHSLVTVDLEGQVRR